MKEKYCSEQSWAVSFSSVALGQKVLNVGDENGGSAIVHKKCPKPCRPKVAARLADNT